MFDANVNLMKKNPQLREQNRAALSHLVSCYLRTPFLKFLGPQNIFMSLYMMNFSTSKIVILIAAYLNRKEGKKLIIKLDYKDYKLEGNRMFVYLFSVFAVIV